MKFFTITTGLIGMAITLVHAADVTYSVVAFPGANENVAVSVANQDFPLQRSPQHANLFTGTAPFGAEYRYTVLTAEGSKPENTTRHLADTTTNTGNEFFGRSKTLYDVPALPRAFNPIYPPLVNGMSRDNEISTVILNADMKVIDEILKEPTEDHDFAQIYNMSYISHDAVYTFEGAGFKNSGQSSKEFAKQSFKIKFNKFNNGTTDNLFGRSSVKLRAQPNDPTLVREKFMMDSLSAAGAAGLSGNWVRLFVNNEPFGLFLMIDDSFKGYTDNFLNGGVTNPSTGVTYKGNAMDEVEEANLVYKGPSNESYNTNDVYILEDTGRDPNVSKKSYTAPLINFMERLNSTVVGSDAQTPGTITDLMDNADHTMIHMAMNFLSGSWDGFWHQASNYYLHENFETHKWYLITYDFDETFGNGEEAKDLMTTPYTNFSRPGSQRPLVDMFIKSPHYEPRFQDILRTIVKRFYNPRVVKPRFDAWAEMLKEDIAWDRSLPFRSPGDKEQFTTQDLDNLFVSVKGRVGVLEWVSNRTSSLCQQLNFDDSDNLPALPAYESHVPASN